VTLEYPFLKYDNLSVTALPVAVAIMHMRRITGPGKWSEETETTTYLKSLTIICLFAVQLQGHD